MTEEVEPFLPNPRDSDAVNTPRRIALLGGSFDPPHLGHVYMTLAVLQRTDIHEVWVLPCADHVDKSDQAPFKERIKMCRLAFSHLRNVHVSEVEAHLPKPNYTVDTLQALTSSRPEWEWFFVVGQDLLEDIPSWSRAEELTDLATLMVVPRQGYPAVDAPEEAGEPIHVDISVQLPEMSSTTIRKVLRRGGRADGFLDRWVAEYVVEKSLYEG